MQRSQIFILSLILFVSCNTKETERSIDIQGHRGARGLAPENSLPAFILATEMGVNTLELDLVVSKDSQLVVSHEPYFSPNFCFDSLGGIIPENSIINIYRLTYDQIKLFDCGTKGNSRFPNQKLIPTYKPLLKEVIDSVESFVINNGLDQVNYNIELKTRKETDSIFHPSPQAFSDLLYAYLTSRGILDRVTVQSFDFRVLKYFHEKYPHVELALLIENRNHWKTNIDSLGFTPKIYSCYYQLLSQENVKEMQVAGMKIIPWTINEISDIEKLVNWEVDGIITDYPDRALKVIKKK